MSVERFVFNGIDGASGDYLLPALSPHLIAAIARDEPVEVHHLRQLEARQRREAETVLAPMVGINPSLLAEAGWGVIFAHDADPLLREALSELLAHRRSEAAAQDERRYQEFSGARGVRPGQAAHQFLACHGVGGGAAVNPDKMPYYLLIVGSPEEIPFKFQYQLDVQHAVGRIHFDTLDQYAQYAHSVVAAETSSAFLPRRVRFFGVQNPDDRATELSAAALVTPLAEKMVREGWDVQAILKNDAYKARLRQVLGGPETPALLFTASHGMGFPNGDPRQLPHQGALLCQDWPGPVQHHGPIPQDFYFSADDIDDDARLLGLIAFHFACYGGGTPRWDDFAHYGLQDRTAIAPHAFVARLPQRLLSHPKGGALAVVAHIERAWGYSFMWWQGAKGTPQLEDFQSTLTQLLDGQPIGWAMEYFSTRYANLASILTSELEEMKFGKIVDEVDLAGMWTANNDARGYAILGDPAVRLRVSAATDVAVERPALGAELPAHLIMPTKESQDTSGISLDDPTITNQPAVTGDELPTGPSKPAVVNESSAVAQEMYLKLSTTLQRLTTKLDAALNEVDTLEVATHLCDTSDNTIQNSQLQVLTRIALDGNTETYISHEHSMDHSSLRDLHCDMITKALTQRTELIKLLQLILVELPDRTELHEPQQ